MKEKKIFLPLSSKHVCQIYELLLEHKYVSFPVTGDGTNKIESLVSSITSIYFDQEIYTTAEEKAVAYLYFLIKDHPFTDGNKRTACLTFEVLCELNELEPNYKEYSLDVMAIYIEKIQEPDHQSVIKMLSEVLFKK
jgi:prophage maintenance system killer protein